jgi:ribosomal-protein-alanine N-acetyltransferase
MLIRTFTEADFPVVVATEAVLHPTPWTEGQFRDSVINGHSLWAAEVDGELAGYAVIMQVLDEAHLLNISVASKHQRCGVGAGLLKFVMAQALGSGAVRMFLEVRASNHAAQALYSRADFITIGRRRDYYARPDVSQREDAIVMAVELTENAPHG